MKNIVTRFLSDQLLLIVGFAVSAIVAFMLISHFRHTILQAWIGADDLRSSEATQLETINTAYTVPADTSQDLGCGCALCCSVPGL